MATYGSFPGIQVTTAGGGITGVQLGEEENLVIFGEGDISGGSASVNDPTQITSRRDADTQFGTDTELSLAMKEALENGANIEFLYGVLVDETSITDESFTGTGTGTLANAPIVEDLSTITVDDTVDGTASSDADFRLEFTYESAPTQPTLQGSETDAVVINPFTGEWAADSSSDYDFDYDYQEWSNAFDAADNVVDETETGVYVALSEAESVSSTLDTKVSDLRDEFKLVTGHTSAQPNLNESVDSDGDGSRDRYDARFDTGAYTDTLDSDVSWMYAPARKEDSSELVLGGVGGVLAGHALDEPVHNERLRGYTTIEQKLTKSEADELRDEQVVPIRQAGSVRLKDNLSTSTETDWTRDFWRRRIVDRVVLIAKEVGEDIIGAINEPETRTAAEDLIRVELEGLVDDGLLEPNTEDETKWFVDVTDDPNTAQQVNIEVGITPRGIVKRIDETITINSTST